MAGETPKERLLSKIHIRPESSCWEWQAARGRDGYGRFKMRGRLLMAHRVSYELHVAPIPDGLTIDHLCRNPACINPDHLQPVTGRENTLRGDTLAARNIAKTHCPRGHRYDVSNTYIRSNGGRNCRKCGRAAERRYRAKLLRESAA